MPNMNPHRNRTNAWQQSGRVSLWRYANSTRNYAGWHLNADAAGCRSLAALLEALATDGTGSRTVALTAPTPAELRAPNHRGGQASWLAPARWRLSLSPSVDAWDFSAALEPAMLSLGSDRLEPFRRALAGIPKGRGDHAIGREGNDSLKLWFW